MAKQHINVGTGLMSGNGEPLRDALIKINQNFDEVYDTYISVNMLKDLLETSTDFNEFKQNIANL
jgi:hypothetical protein